MRMPPNALHHDSAPCPQGASLEGPHWVEITDVLGRLPAQRLGPYASAVQASRACRGAMRVLNAARYTAVVRLDAERRD